MKVSIRQGVFETNSSSVHAIVIDTSGKKEREAFRWYSGPELNYYHDRMTMLLPDAESRLDYLWTAIWDLKTNYVVNDFAKSCMENEFSLYSFYKRVSKLPDLDWWMERLATFWLKIDIDENDKVVLLSHFQEAVMEDRRIPPEYRDSTTRGMDRIYGILPFVERLVYDDQLLVDYMYGRGSYVLVTSDDEYDYEHNFENDASKVIDAELVIDSFKDDNDSYNYNRFHEFPESNKVIFIKESEWYHSL